ncbi:DUF2635 domain-containing protein [Pseudomonas mediterranea]|uniref:DUF2635 domain-containing protein n=1 Tax=Pseudomonas mediterranea TaxID=183795 RepID=A0AAX2DIM7_9PSED|nr:DUF2635 domain-containing protein [Pseudomonas mediterranea]KGU84829.1 hypothetical protein N005_15815 [Pseudomonas mediterranea CFBP 5447]SDU74647.1 Protein of unknown function [Pseudomonas mediterranea]
MTNRITVVPASGRSVPDPEASDLLPAEGREVPDNAWWRRRLADGDVTLKAEKAQSTKAGAPAKAEEAQ